MVVVHLKKNRYEARARLHLDSNATCNLYVPGITSARRNIATTITVEAVEAPSILGIFSEKFENEDSKKET